MSGLCGHCFQYQMSRGVCSACNVQAPPPHAYEQALPVGTLIGGKYKIGYVLGKPGGFGIAYRGYEEVLQRTVVVKELFPGELVYRDRAASDSAEVLALGVQHRKAFGQQKSFFIEEARKVAQLEEIDSIVRILGYFEENGTAYIVMPYVDGRSLSDPYNGQLTFQRAIDIFSTISRGVADVHRQGIIHRDIKPDNILLRKNGAPILIDFGNAISTDRLAQLISEGDQGYCGYSKWYTAPEQHAGGTPGKMAPSTDVYALCAVLYFMLAHEAPTDSLDRLSGVPLKKLQGDEENILKLNEILIKGMDLNPDERYQTADELLQACEFLFAVDLQNDWISFLPDDDFGARMRKIHGRLLDGKPLAVQWNASAALLQWFWFFGHGIVFAGWGLTLFVVIFAAAGLYFGYLGPLLLLAIILGGIFSGAYGDALSYRHSVASLEEFKSGSASELRRVLSSLGGINPRHVLLGLGVPVALLLLSLMQSSREATTRDMVRMAIQSVDALKDEYGSYYSQNSSVPASVSDLGVETAPNSELSKLELVSGNFMLTLAVPEVAGRRVNWLAKLTSEGGIEWKCENVDVPLEYLPDNCH